MTIPVGVSACARNSIGQDKLSDLALFSIEKKILKSINYEEVINTFAQSKSRKKIFQ